MRQVVINRNWSTQNRVDNRKMGVNPNLKCFRYRQFEVQRKIGRYIVIVHWVASVNWTDQSVLGS